MNKAALSSCPFQNVVHYGGFQKTSAHFYSILSSFPYVTEIDINPLIERLKTHHNFTFSDILKEILKITHSTTITRQNLLDKV